MKLKKIISCLMSVIISLVCFSGMTAVAEDEIRLGYWVFDTDCYDVITPSLSYINAATVEITSFANPYRLLIPVGTNRTCGSRQRRVFRVGGI